MLDTARGTAQGATRSDFLKRAAATGAAVAAGGALAGVGPAGAADGRGTHRPGGIHDRLNRTSHWDLNVADLERARTWWETTTPLRMVAETSADQAFPSLGIARGRFEGYMMQDPSGGPNSPMLHLVEWKTPRPVGVAYTSHANVGWNRIVIFTTDIARSRELVISQGTQPILPTSDFLRVPLHPELPPMPYVAFTTPDPEGVFIQFFSTTEARWWGVNHNTADLDRYVPFHLDLLGFDFTIGIGNPEASPNVYGGRGELTTFEGIFMAIRGDQRVLHDYLEWADSRRFPTPYREPTHRGIIRCAIEVDDLEAAHKVLRRSEWARKKRFVLNPPEEWDYGEAFGTRTVVTFQNPEGTGFQLLQQPPYQLAQLHPFGVDLFPSPRGGSGKK